MSDRRTSLQVDTDEGLSQSRLRRSGIYTDELLQAPPTTSAGFVPVIFSSGDTYIPNHEAREDGISIGDTVVSPAQSWSPHQRSFGDGTSGGISADSRGRNGAGTASFSVFSRSGHDSQSIDGNDVWSTALLYYSVWADSPSSRPIAPLQLADNHDNDTEDGVRSRAIRRRLAKLYEHHVQTYGSDFSRWPTCGMVSMTKNDKASIRAGRSWKEFVDSDKVHLTLSDDGSRADLASKIPDGVLVYSLIMGKNDRSRKKGAFHPGSTSARNITSIPFAQLCKTSLIEGKYLPVLLCRTSQEVLKRMNEKSGSSSSHAAVVHSHSALATEFSKSRHKTQCENCGDFYRKPKHKVDQEANNNSS
ncbi:hypothetical protein I302_109064 [Kwoniella bestiolae CBS 10118]|uniref:Uncharacterized protein n=1 Tax=Kwoniella bestiolae CBS 10118 TaxID=1296100 RepID=A0A1B9FUX1_9TREE|nr:hypothetical protein I302_08208 [Kwoniella bestiolae CBS 10118]OCF22558.1 hypothetical protein I302_08208 [Kwoniella bestiolae CBS 10118]